MKYIKRPVYAFDFETVVNIERTRVWAWGATNVNSMTFNYGNNIDSFMDFVSMINCKGYFHNLKFDIQFIFYWLFHNGYKHTTARRPNEGEFSTLISEMGQFYKVNIKFFNGNNLELLDSHKILTMKLAEIPKTFGLNIEKKMLNYEEVLIDDLEHELTGDELDYLRADCDILALGLREIDTLGLKKMTTASNAMAYYKKMIGDEWDKLYPQLTLSTDRDIRKSYKGGWTYLNPIYKDVDVDIGQVYDVNSMYPWAMKYCALPYGEPVYYDGEYDYDSVFPLYIQCFEAIFELKEKHFPSIQLKGSTMFADTEYITTSNGEKVLLTLTSVDFELFVENYDITDIEYICGYKFRALTGQFADYVDVWYGKKNEAKREGNKQMAFMAKLMLNSLYGKFGSNPVKTSKYPYLGQDDIIHYEKGYPEETKTNYVPVATFITSYCRDKIIRTANAVYDRFVYADTDSIHIIWDEIPNIDIDEYRLGAFKLESEFNKARFHRSKCYIENIDGKENKKCAGLPEDSRKDFTLETMKTGAQFGGKLVPVQVPGGVVLVDRQFTIK